MTQPSTASTEVHTHVDDSEFWIMAAPDTEITAAIDAATEQGFTAITRQWHDAEHGWDVMVLERT